MIEYKKLMNSYNPKHYPANKKISAEEWNALWSSIVYQGNHQEDTIYNILNSTLPEYKTILEEIELNVGNLESNLNTVNQTLLNKQNKTDYGLSTQNKTVVGAINEVNNNNITNSNILLTKQDKIDNSLTTQNKTIVGSINEVNNNKLDKNFNNLNELLTLQLENYIAVRKDNETFKLSIQKLRAFLAQSLTDLRIEFVEELPEEGEPFTFYMVPMIKTKEEYDTISDFPVVGEINIRYIALDTNKKYSWSNETSEYVNYNGGYDEYMWFENLQDYDLIGTTKINLIASEVSIDEINELESNTVQQALEKLKIISDKKAQIANLGVFELDKDLWVLNEDLNVYEYVLENENIVNIIYQLSIVAFTAETSIAITNMELSILGTKLFLDTDNKVKCKIYLRTNSNMDPVNINLNIDLFLVNLTSTPINPGTLNLIDINYDNKNSGLNATRGQEAIDEIVFIKADKNNPNFTGIVIVPTVPLETSNTQAANTAYVKGNLNNYVIKEEDKGLSTNDYDNTEKDANTANTAARHTHSNKAILDTTTASFTTEKDTKLAGIQTGAQVNTVTGVKGNSEENYRTGNINITKTDIGLSNVDNTSDTNKPISNAQQTALSNKVDKISGKGLSTNDLTNELKIIYDSGVTNIEKILDGTLKVGNTEKINDIKIEFDSYNNLLLVDEFIIPREKIVLSIPKTGQTRPSIYGEKVLVVEFPVSDFKFKNGTIYKFLGYFKSTINNIRYNFTYECLCDFENLNNNGLIVNVGVVDNSNSYIFCSKILISFGSIGGSSMDDALYHSVLFSLYEDVNLKYSSGQTITITEIREIIR